MFDSDQPAVLTEAITTGCRVATYADLLTPELVRQFTGRLVVIDRGLGDPLDRASVADCEAGALTIAQAAERVRLWHAAGRRWPTVYHDRADWPAVAEACKGLAYWNWVATLDGTLNPDGRRPAVVQFAGASRVGAHTDVSVVWNDSWHPLPVPQLAGLRDKLTAAADGLTAQVGDLQRLIGQV